jgi:DNA-binding PadR family transcriptional regulator
MKSKVANPKTTTAEALLGVLSIAPRTGYEIRQFVEGTIGNFWSESFGQIYPALKRLQAEGWVEATATGKAGSRIFSLTDAGRARLTEWLAVPAKPQVARNELLLKIFFGRNAPPGALRAQVLETRELCVADLARYEALGPMIHQRVARDAGRPYYLMTLNYGLAEARAILAWCDETLEMLDEIAGQ